MNLPCARIKTLPKKKKKRKEKNKQQLRKMYIFCNKTWIMSSTVTP